MNQSVFLQALHLENFRSLDDVSFDFQSADDSTRAWTLLLGENGCGKSCNYTELGARKASRGRIRLAAACGVVARPHAGISQAYRSPSVPISRYPCGFLWGYPGRLVDLVLSD